MVLNSRTWVFVVAWLVLGSVAAGQTATGSLAGSILDETGAAIRGADVILANQGNGQRFEQVTTDVGVYLFPALTPGTYTLRVSTAGFKTSRTTDLIVSAGRVTTHNIRLAVGPVVTEVVVSAGAELLDRTGAAVGATIGKIQIDKLPIEGRDPLQLLNLVAGFSDNLSLAQPVMAGNRTVAVNVTMDGVNIQENFTRSRASSFSPAHPTMDTVSEMTVITQNQGPDSGFGSSQVRLVTPAARNDLHGNAYWYHRNSATAANEFFNNRSGVERPSLIRHQYGASLSGPVIRDKLLVWGNFEGQLIKQSRPVTAVVPQPSIRNGDFSYFDDEGSVRSINLFELSGLGPDPFMVEFLKLVPTHSNNSDVFDSLNTAGLRFNRRFDNSRWQFKTRTDFSLSERHSFEGVYQAISDRTLSASGGTFSETLPISHGGDRRDFFSVSWKWSISPNLINELRTGGFWFESAVVPDGGGLAEPRVLAIGFKLNGLFFTNPLSSFELQNTELSTVNIQDNASWRVGAHSIRFGFQSTLLRTSRGFCRTCIPEFTLGASAINERTALDPEQFPGGIRSSRRRDAEHYLAVLAGFVERGQQEWNITDAADPVFQPVLPNFAWLYDTYALYIGDTWRIRPDFTLNLGLRWELTGELDEEQGLVSHIIASDPSTEGTMAALRDENSFYDIPRRSLSEGDFDNLAPNIGFAWDLHGDGRMTLRAGYGLSYINDGMLSTATWLTREGVSATVSLENLTATISDGLPVFEAPEFELPLPLSVVGERNPSGGWAFAVPDDLALPYVQTWNVSLGRQLGQHTALELRYLGTKGTGLRRSVDINQVGTGAADFAKTGFFEDFLNARQNGLLAEAATGDFNPAYNPEIPGSVPLPTFDRLENGGFLTSGLVRSRIFTGEMGELANIYMRLGWEGDVLLRPNSNVPFALLPMNQASSTYHSGTVEVSRRFHAGLLFNANYTFSKVLTDASGRSASNNDFFVDIDNPGYDRGRAEFDLTHAFKAHFVYQLPFGNNRPNVFDQRWIDAILGGWDVSSIFIWQSGAPFGFNSRRGTVNSRTRCSRRCRPNSSVTVSELRKLMNITERDGRIYFIDPSAIGPNGRAVSPDGVDPFEGQVFSHPGPGELGNLPPRPFNGPSHFNWDARVAKTIAIGSVGAVENIGLEFQADFFNLLNNHTFGVARFPADVDSSRFGTVTRTVGSPRIVQFGLRLNW